MGWAFWRFTRPLMGQSESEIDMALLVERQQEIDSDLVAAIQFEAPEAARWGSPQLESAVIDYVASVGRGINVFEGFSREQMLRRGGLLAISRADAVLDRRHSAPAMRRRSSIGCCSGRCTIRPRTVIEQIADQRQAGACRPSAQLAGQPACGRAI